MKAKLIVLAILIVVLISIAIITISFLINKQPVTKHNFLNLLAVIVFCYLLSLYLIFRFISLSKTYNMVKGFQDNVDILEICEDVQAEKEFDKSINDDFDVYEAYKKHKSNNPYGTDKF